MRSLGNLCERPFKSPIFARLCTLITIFRIQKCTPQEKIKILPSGRWKAKEKIKAWPYEFRQETWKCVDMPIITACTKRSPSQVSNVEPQNCDADLLTTSSQCSSYHKYNSKKQTLNENRYRTWSIPAAAAATAHHPPCQYDARLQHTHAQIHLHAHTARVNFAISSERRIRPSIISKGEAQGVGGRTQRRDK